MHVCYYAVKYYTPGCWRLIIVVAIMLRSTSYQSIPSPRKLEDAMAAAATIVGDITPKRAIDASANAKVVINYMAPETRELSSPRSLQRSAAYPLISIAVMVLLMVSQTNAKWSYFSIRSSSDENRRSTKSYDVDSYITNDDNKPMKKYQNLHEEEDSISQNAIDVDDEGYNTEQKSIDGSDDSSSSDDEDGDDDNNVSYGAMELHAPLPFNSKEFMFLAFYYPWYIRDDWNKHGTQGHR